MKLNKKSRVCIAIVATILSLLGISIFVWLLGRNQAEVDEVDFDTGWRVSVNGTELEPQDILASYKFSGLQPYDEVVLTNQLPENAGQNKTLTFLFYLSAVEVEMDGDTIYTYGQDYLEQSLLVGSGYHFVNLPDDAGGKEIRITLTVGEPNAFTSVMTPTFSTTYDVYRVFAKRHMVMVFVCTFLTLLGGMLTIISVVALCFNRSFLRLFYIGVFSFLMGVWSMCNMKVLQIFRVDLAANTQTEYLTLYLAPIVFFLMIGEMNRDAATWKKQCIHGIVILMTTFAAVATILQATNMEHYPRLLSYFHIFGGVSLALVAVCSIGKEKKRDSVDKSMLVGILILGASVALDLVRFNIQKYMLQDERWLTISVIPIGALLFVVMLLISYIFYIYNMLVTRAEQEWLAERAYHDELCHTFNRTKCNEEFLKMDASARPYALINMDLNGLKTINDTYGHTQGDLLLQEFASILQAAFRGVGDVFRMGGDEFLVIVQEEQFDLIDDAVVRMENLEKRRSGELPFVIDASYGIAKSIECVPVKTEKVYTLADQRMYEMKVSKKRGNRLR